MSVNQNNYKEVLMPDSLHQALSEIKNIMGGSMELLINEVRVSGHECALVCSEGLVSTLNISSLILTPLTEISLPEGTGPRELKEHIQKNMLLGIDRPAISNYDEFIRFLMSGFALIIINGTAGATGLVGPSVQKHACQRLTQNMLNGHNGCLFSSLRRDWHINLPCR